MSAQTNYSFNPSIGVAGGIVDLAPYAIDTFVNEETTGTLKFGMGVVAGANAGKTIAIPADGATAADFEGVVTNNRTTEHNLEGKVSVRENASVGVMRYGRIYARVATDVTPNYGDALYLVVSGDDAGCFTNAEGDNAVAVKGRFIGSIDSTVGVAPVELFNQAQA